MRSAFERQRNVIDGVSGQARLCWNPNYRRLLMQKLALLLVLLALSPLWPAARLSAATPPPAINFDVNFQVTGPDGDFAAVVKGAANQSGDARISIVSYTHPEFPPIAIINLNNAVYVSIDGEPYQAMTDDSGIPIGGFGHGGKRPPMEVSAGCEAMGEQIRSLMQSQAGPQILESLAGIQDLGQVNVAGGTAEHYGGSISSDSLLANPLVSFAVDQAIASCAGPSFGVNRSQLQSFLAGSVASFDASIDADNVPRQFSLTVNVPSIQVQFSASGTVTPLAAPVPISVP
jgi:hypothetical protein